MIRDHLLIYHGWHPDYVRATTPERLAAGHEAEHRPYSEYLHTQKHDHLPAVSAQPDGEST